MFRQLDRDGDGEIRKARVGVGRWRPQGGVPPWSGSEQALNSWTLTTMAASASGNPVFTAALRRWRGRPGGTAPRRLDRDGDLALSPAEFKGPRQEGGAREGREKPRNEKPRREKGDGGDVILPRAGSEPVPSPRCREP